ncbi:unnamed protein product [Moneuplotes crassus]|uniref:Uncharacterized protein n=1 Tax=Euplotes crassus TaxID=5936 RepID=A0AAD1XN09_EUPCR|nr:unnamed protein product [Moneuplotes crassus]
MLIFNESLTIYCAEEMLLHLLVSCKRLYLFDLKIVFFSLFNLLRIGWHFPDLYKQVVLISGCFLIFLIFLFLLSP